MNILVSLWGIGRVIWILSVRINHIKSGLIPYLVTNAVTHSLSVCFTALKRDNSAISNLISIYLGLGYDAKKVSSSFPCFLCLWGHAVHSCKICSTSIHQWRHCNSFQRGHYSLDTVTDDSSQRAVQYVYVFIVLLLTQTEVCRRPSPESQRSTGRDIQDQGNFWAVIVIS